MPIRAVSFDLFDTLVHVTGIEGIPRSTRALYEAVQEHASIGEAEFTAELRAVDRELHRPRYREGIEISSERRFADLAGRLGIDVPDLPRRLTEIHMGIVRECVRVPGHHLDVLRRLRRRARVGLCSNFTHGATARAILGESCLDHELDPIVISVEVGIRKPRREIFEALLAGLGAPPEETLHVGDNLRADVAGAAALGMRTVWVTAQVGDAEAALASHDGPMPDYVVRDLDEIPPLLGA